MTTICPTITAESATDYRFQMERVALFASRIHIDLADGMLAPRKLIPIEQIWWPDGLHADLHVMYQRPFQYLDELMALRPHLITVHAEAEGDFDLFASKTHQQGIKTGVALLPSTPVELIQKSLNLIDHMLIFSGNLGYQGGSKADFGLLRKVKQLRLWKPLLEIGWDGGINSSNARQLVLGGVDVLNAGGFIQHATNPREAYEQLSRASTSSE